MLNWPFCAICYRIDSAEWYVESETSAQSLRRLIAARIVPQVSIDRVITGTVVAHLYANYSALTAVSEQTLHQAVVWKLRYTTSEYR